MFCIGSAIAWPLFLSHRSASDIFSFRNPLSAESGLTIIIKFQNLRRPWPKNALFSPNVLGLERGTLVSFPKLSETPTPETKRKLINFHKSASPPRPPKPPPNEAVPPATACSHAPGWGGSRDPRWAPHLDCPERPLSLLHAAWKSHCWAGVQTPPGHQDPGCICRRSSQGAEPRRGAWTVADGSG